MNENKKKLTIKDNPKEILNLIVEEHGIGIIKEFLNEYNRRLRKRAPKGNSYIEIATEVYSLIEGGRYGIMKAIEKVADRRNLSINTVRNHKARFDKEAIKNNFYTYGEVINELEKKIVNPYDYGTSDYFDSLIDELAKINDLSRSVIDAYYTKYKLEKQKKDNKYTADYSKIKLNDKLESELVPF